MNDWASTSFVFAGQGSQAVGMGRDFADASPLVRAVFEEADDLLGFRLSRLCFEGPEDVLNTTIHTQPALYVYGIAVLRLLQAEVFPTLPDFLAGHSFGEITALVAAESLSFADGLRLVRERGRVMQAAGQAAPGGMAAVLGIDAVALREICTMAERQTGGTLVIANDNCPGQIVISGDLPTLEIGTVLAKTAGVRRIVRLAVSIAAHSPLMQPAAVDFAAALAEVDFKPPLRPVYGNVTTEPLTDAVAIRAELTQQLTHTVRWTESVQRMIADGAAHFIEFGPGDVLSKLIRRIDDSVSTLALSSYPAFLSLSQTIQE
ncbi:MAG: ACP S-malonyltransferase [bacterium]|nr:ACP S-malonyltransferase [bacterium]